MDSGVSLKSQIPRGHEFFFSPVLYYLILGHFIISVSDLLLIWIHVSKYKNLKKRKQLFSYTDFS